jgi:hypothetical protein
MHWFFWERCSLRRTMKFKIGYILDHGVPNMPHHGCSSRHDNQGSNKCNIGILGYYFRNKVVRGRSCNSVIQQFSQFTLHNNVLQHVHVITRHFTSLQQCSSIFTLFTWFNNDLLSHCCNCVKHCFDSAKIMCYNNDFPVHCCKNVLQQLIVSTMRSNHDLWYMTVSLVDSSSVTDCELQSTAESCSVRGKSRVQELEVPAELLLDSIWNHSVYSTYSQQI